VVFLAKIDGQGEGKWVIFTDGACSGNPGPGGWGSIILSPEGSVFELGAGAPSTTNNRMELSAAIFALRAIAGDAGPVTLYADSSYVINGATKWHSSWERRGWKTMEGKPVLNADLWRELMTLVAKRNPAINWRYVPGHAGIAGNDRCDEIAVAFSHSEAAELYQGSLKDYPVEVLWGLEDHEIAAAVAAKGPSRRRRSKSGGTYLSLLDGILMRHPTWIECETRVKGKRGAKFKKVFSSQEEAETLQSWSKS
jgi:ribonuclease HI